MAGGIDWFRWHHGSVSDPKFGLVAKRAGARLGDVIALWAFVLESASSSEERGTVGQLDLESIDFMLGMDDGMAARILDAMTARGLLGAGGRVEAWEKRQPKREREDDTAAERKRRQREREAAKPSHDTPDETTGGNVTPRHATSRQKTPRGEESREEKETPQPPAGEPAGFLDFWQAWPNTDRKQAKGKCLEAWKKAHAERDAAVIVAHVERMKGSKDWQKNNGDFVPAPLVYLNQRRWDGASASDQLGESGLFAGVI